MSRYSSSVLKLTHCFWPRSVASPFRTLPTRCLVSPCFGTSESTCESDGSCANTLGSWLPSVALGISDSVGAAPPAISEKYLSRSCQNSGTNSSKASWATPERHPCHSRSSDSLIPLGAPSSVRPSRLYLSSFPDVFISPKTHSQTQAVFIVSAANHSAKS